MPDKPSAPSLPAAQPHDTRPAAGDSPGGPHPRVSHGPRGVEVRDAMAEMAERAQLIGQEAGAKIATAMRDVISAAAGMAGFAVESVRDLVQYMVRRGQMTQDEADRLIREAEEARAKRAPKAEPKITSAPAAPKEPPAARGSAKSAKKAPAKSSAAATEKKPAPKKPTPKKRR